MEEGMEASKEMTPHELAKHELASVWAKTLTDEMYDGPTQDGTMYAFAARWFHFAYENCLLAARKQADYGSKNIEATGLYGVAVRMLDKVSRLLNLTKDRVYSVRVDETLEDTMADLSNYGIIGQMVFAGEWGQWDR